ERVERDRLATMATTDALTGLPNRALLYERVHLAITAAQRGRGGLALLLMDLDRFKEVNDTFGHQMGDTLLVEVARRLSGVMRESDTVARLGGDEFALLLPNTAEADAVAVAGRIAAAIEQPFHIEDQHLDVGISIGIALYPIHGPDGATLMQHADVAMYQAKRERTTHALYRPHEDENTPTRFGLGAELRLALDQHQVLLHYQPKIGLATGRVDAVEALVRWNHPDLGLVPPGDFMPMAERSGLIQPLTAWIIDEAARQHHSWRDLGHDLRVAVNLSAQSLHDAGLVGMVREILEAREIAPDRLVLEITEAAVLVNAERALATVTELHAMGVRISVDDFGKGRSSLVNLRRLPADELKIDQSFVIDMAAGQQDDVIVRVMIDLAHGLGLAAVAEGVQDEKTYKLLVEMECDQAQGFHIGRPMPGWELGLWLDQHVAAPRPSLRPPLQFRPRAQAGA
ncbi:MAG: EAL domain-containing protein, partial [Chloroflexi bacterium]|nr:EAL domain-containing protein [Chloroflexota bacterium]